MYHVLCYNIINYRCFNLLGCWCAGWVRPCVGMMGWAGPAWGRICKLAGRIGLGEEKLTLVHLYASPRKILEKNARISFLK